LLAESPVWSRPGKVTVSLLPLFNAETLEIAIVKDTAHPTQRGGDVTITRQPDGKIFKGSYLTTQMGKNPISLTTISTEAAVFDELDKADFLEIKAGAFHTTIAIVRFAKAKPVFAQCQDDLLRSWKVDPAVFRSSKAAEPTGHPENYFGPSDYPPEALHSGYTGRVITVLQVNAAGRVGDCRVVVGAGESLNVATCKVARKIKFKPGHDPAGEPIPSIFVLPVRWILP
jgi:TonB family protein